VFSRFTRLKAQKAWKSCTPRNTAPAQGLFLTKVIY
jgi:hypothetical protein